MPHVAEKETATTGGLLKIEEVQSYLGVSRSTVYALKNSGELVAVHVGRSLRFPKVSVEEFARKLMER